nr:MAG TPA: hypothetical protein [Caudoviricetes sp.]
MLHRCGALFVCRGEAQHRSCCRCNGMVFTFVAFYKCAFIIFINLSGFIKIFLDFCGRIIYNIITARETERVGGQAQKGGRHGRYGHDRQAVCRIPPFCNR